MKVVRAQNAGACYGVQRALDLALQASEGNEPVSTLGPLIHNPQVVQELEQRGVKSVESADDVHEGSIIIRSHGVVPQVKRQLHERGLPVIDATCPHVARAQKAAEKLAHSCGQVVVVGEAGHPEVEGLVAYAREAGAKVWVAAKGDDLPPLTGKVGVVVQTTQTKEALQSVVDGLRKQGIEPEVKDTVCFATRQRQQAAAQLAHEVDALVVVGGKNSSNTTRLAEICREVCPNTQHVESVSELDFVSFNNCKIVGLTAGASTPEDQIASVEDWLISL